MSFNCFVCLEINNRAKIKPKKTTIDASMEVLTFLLILGSVILIATNYTQLPQMLPIHFNWPSKDENGFGTKDVLWINPIICGMIAIGIYKLNKYPWIFNYPLTIDTANAQYNYRQAMLLLRAVNLTVGLLCFSMTLMSVLDGLGVKNDLSRYLKPAFVILLLGLPLAYLLKIIIYKKHLRNK